MATEKANAKTRQHIRRVNLYDVKLLISQQEPNYKLMNWKAPLHQWEIESVQFEGNESQTFAIGSDVYTGKLSLNLTFDTFDWCVTLEISRAEDYESKPEEEKYHSFQHFVCKFKYLDRDEQTYESFVMSKNSFISAAEKNDIYFYIKRCYEPVGDAKVEVNLERSTISRYVFPSSNAVAGKIEYFSLKMKMVNKKEMLLVSPRFDFGSTNQMMIAQFRRSYDSERREEGVMVTLHVINKGIEQSGPPFDLDVTFTYFSQSKNGRDFCRKRVLERIDNKCEYQVGSDLIVDLKTLGCLEGDTLYYRATVENTKGSK